MDNPSSLLLGALVGAAVQPLFNLIAEAFSKKTQMEVGLHSALLLLFIANTFVLIGEILILPPIRSDLPGLSLIFLFALAILICSIYNIQKRSQFIESELVLPIMWLIFGNLAWGVSEVAELILIEFGASGDPGTFSRWIRVTILSIGAGCFIVGLYRILRLIPRRKET